MDLKIRGGAPLKGAVEVPADKISLEAQLQDDLELDSIDAIDLAIHLQEITGKRLEEEALRELRTIADVISFVEKLIAEQAAAAPAAP